jgi:GntR family transcriptional regulator
LLAKEARSELTHRRLLNYTLGMLKLNHQSSVPLRAQVEQLLRELVREPQYQRGALLPDEVKLAAQLGISRGTVRSGISKLVFEGILERKAGVGTRVSRQHVESGIRAWRSFTREMAAKGITVQNFRLDYRLTALGAEAAEAFQLSPATRVWRLDRVRGWNGKPVLLSTSWFHPRLGLKGEEDFTAPLYETLEKTTGVLPHHAREEFLATVADGQAARLLQVKEGAPLLLRRHTVFDPGSRPFEFAEVRYVSSRFTLSMDMRRGEE